MFGRSFDEIGAAIAGRLDGLGRDSQSADGLANPASIFRRLYPSKESIQPKLKNVDALYPKIDARTFNFDGWIKKLNLIDKKVQRGVISWTDYSNGLDENQRWIAKWGQQTQGQIRTQEDMVRANQAARSSALAQNEALMAQTFSAKAGSMAFRSLAAIGNMALFTAIAEGIQLVANAMDSWIHADEIALEKASEAQSRVDGLNSSYKSHKDAARELGAQYERLSKGVDTSTNANLSLSDEDYKSYLDITNQLAEAFPTLRTALDENGNAILSLGQDGRTASEELAKLLETEEELNSYEISKDLGALFAGVSVRMKDAEADAALYNESQEALDNIRKLMEGQSDLSEGIRVSGDFSQKADSAYYNAIYAAMQEFYESLSTDRKLQLADALDPGKLMEVDSRGGFDFYLSTFLLTPEEQQQLQDRIKTQAGSTVGLIGEQIGDLFHEQAAKKQDAELAWKDFLPSLTAAMKSKSTFQSLGEGPFGKEIQDLAADIVSGLDSDIAYEMEKTGGAYEWVFEYILLPLTKLDDSGRESVGKAFNRLLALNPDDLSETNQSSIDQFTRQIAEKLGMDSETIRLNLGFEADEKLAAQYDAAIKDASEKFGTPKSSTEDTFTELGIDTTEEIDSWNKVAAEASDAADAAKRYKEATRDTTSFSKAWASLDNPDAWTNTASMEDVSASSLKDSYLSLAKAGQLTSEAFLSVHGSESFLARLGLNPNDTDEIKDIVSEINALVSSTDQLSSMERGISGLSANLQAKQQNPDSAISAATFSGMDAGLKAQTAEWDNYVSVLGNASSSTEEIQDATNKLATAYMKSSNFLANLTEANQGYYVSQLQAMNIDNAEELVQQSLMEKCQIHELSLKALALTKDDVNAKTINSAADLLTEANASEAVRCSIAKCIASERIFSEQNLNSKDKVAQLKQLITAFCGVGLAAEFAASLTNKDAKNPYEELTPEAAFLNIMDKAAKAASIPTDIGSGSGGSAASSPAPEKTETPEDFDFIETALSRIKSRLEDVKTAAKEAFRSFTDRGKTYAAALSAITEEINAQEQAKAKYMDKANSVGLEANYAIWVQNGDSEIRTVKDEGIKQRIREYKEWYEKALACGKAVSDLKTEQEALARESIELMLTHYDKRNAAAESAKDRAQANMERREAWGMAPSAKSYAQINKSSVKQIGYYKSMNEELEKLKKTVSEGSEAWEEYQERIDSNNKSVIDLKANIFETAKEAAALAAQKAEKKTAKNDSNIEFLDAQMGNTIKAKKKNTLIDAKIANINQQKDAYKAAVADDKKSVRNASNVLNKFKQTADNKTLLKKIRSHVKSGKKLPGSLLKAAGKLSDNGKLLAACAKYNAYMDAFLADKEAAALFAQTSKTDIADLWLEKFSNNSGKWDNKIYNNTQKETSLNARIGINEAGGKKKYNQKLYNSQITNAESIRKKLIQKRNALQKQLDKLTLSGKVKKGSSQWYQMTQEIDGTVNAIDEAAQSVLNYKKALQSLKWDLFDEAMDTLKRVNTEADYYIDRMADEELVSKDSGSLTDYGNATLALRKNNYDSYLAQAEQYQKKYEKMEKRIRKGKLDGSDTDVIARMRELKDAQQEMILMAQEELQMGKSLLQEVYDKQLEKVSELISKYKELMHSEKDAYEYQRTIEQKVKDIATLQKRMDAYAANDDTEENRAKIQKIKTELADAKQGLKDTQYDKYLSDTETMLDEMYEDMESFLEGKLDNTDAILEGISQTLGSGSEAIVETLRSIDGGLSSVMEGLIKGLQTNSDLADKTVADSAIVPTPPDTGNIKNQVLEGEMHQRELPFKKKDKKKQKNKKTSGRKRKPKYPSNGFLIEKHVLEGKDSLQKPLSLEWSIQNKNKTLEDLKDSAKEEELRNPGGYFAENEILESIFRKAGNGIAGVYDPYALMQGVSLASLQEPTAMTPPAENVIGTQNISIDLGGITMNGVSDPQAFAQQLREEICQNGQTTRCITQAVLSSAMGNGIGRARLYRH